MRSWSSSCSALSLVVAVALAAIAPHARGVTAERPKIQNASGACQPALPAFDGLVRKRPLGLANEGTQTAFVTCSFQANNVTGAGHLALSTRFRVSSGAGGTVSCTLVDGVEGAALAPRYSTKSVTVFPGEGAGHGWLGSEFSAPTGMVLPNLSCSLPPGVTFSFVSTLYREEVGA